MDTLLILSVFVLAGLVKGFSGLGLPTIALALLGLMVAPGEAAALVAVPAFLTNLWQALRGGGLVVLLARLWPMLLGVGLGTALGGAWRPDPDLARLVLAEALMLYAMLGLLEVVPSLPAGGERWLGAGAGVLTGVLTAVTGVFVLPAVPFLQALRLPPGRLVQALGLSFTVSSAALGVLLASHGALALPQLGLSLAATLPALAGMALGARLRPFVAPAHFRRGVFCFLFAIAVSLLIG